MKKFKTTMNFFIMTVFPWVCTLALFGLGGYQIVMRQLETVTMWDPEDAAAMAIPGTPIPDCPSCRNAAVVAEETAGFGHCKAMVGRPLSEVVVCCITIPDAGAALKCAAYVSDPSRVTNR